MAADRRIAVTGLGAISALGHSAVESWKAACEPRSGIALHTLDPGPDAPEAQTLPLARVEPGFERAVEAHFGRRVCGQLDRFAALALAAAFEGLRDAALLDDPDLHRAAVVLGHGFGGAETLEKGYQRYFGARIPRVHPITVPRAMLSAGVSAVAMSFGIRGPVFAVSSACASSAHAVAQGAALIQMGAADVAVTGGSEAIITPATMRAWDAVRALSSETCRPFSTGRDGMVMGEGAAALVLEELEHARRRGARVLGELVGIGMSSDAHHLTQPSLEGPVTAMTQAHRAAGLAHAKGVLIAAHGTGTPLNDENEAAAIHAVFGDRAAQQPVIATKSAHGHLIGGSAALQAVIGLHSLAEQLAPPILNYLGPDPLCVLDLVLERARRISCSHLLVNAFAFGGLNACLAFAAARQTEH
jgi:nodulation protein E